MRLDCMYHFVTIIINEIMDPKGFLEEKTLLGTKRVFCDIIGYNNTSLSIGYTR